MTDATGTGQNFYSFGAWGELLASSATVANSYGYTGREFSEEGLYFYRARYLDPGLGRFFNRYLFRLSKGRHFYSYVTNNPIKYNDPFGYFGEITDNQYKDSSVYHLQGDALTLATCIEDCLMEEITITSGSEPEVNGKKRASNDPHLSHQAFDMRNWGLQSSQHDVLCCAVLCGAQWAHGGNHYHFQTVAVGSDIRGILPQWNECSICLVKGGAND